VTALTVALVAPATAGPATDEGASFDPAGDAVVADIEAPQRTVTYEVHTRGSVQADRAEFAAIARDILSDARGWTLGGSIEFVPVADGGDFHLVLASPQAVDDAHEVCSPAYSCRVGDDVLINDRNWRESTAAFRDAGGPLWLYRQYLINHEVGHVLGFGHFDCGGAGEPAPVMQQQSISLDGCEPNGWPLDWEREELADELGVPTYTWTFTDVLYGDTHRHDIHLVTDEGLAEGYDDGTFRPDDAVRRDQMATFLARAMHATTDAEPPYGDVRPDQAHATAIAAISEYEVAQGYGDGTFRPGEVVTRAQMASFLTRAYRLEADRPPPYDDVDADGTHAEPIAAVTEAGIAAGYDDGTFRPAEPVTRAQMAAFLARAEASLD
jgi:hypothetical protein